MEKKSLRVVAVIFLIFLGIVLFFILKDKDSNKEDAIKFKEEYEAVNANAGAVQMTISENNPIVYIESYEELNKKILNKDNFVLYLGFPTCPWCRNIIPVLFEVATENKVKEVYYINVRELKNSSEDYKNLFEVISDYLEEDEEGEKVLYVPEVFFFQDGKIIGHHLGSVDSQTNPNNPLTETQKNELKRIYQGYFDKIK